MVGLPGPVPRRLCACGEWLPHACDQPAVADDPIRSASVGASERLGERVCRRIVAARKLQALTYIAWPPGELAERLGIPLGMLLAVRLGKAPGGHGSALSPDLYARICQLFGQLEGTRGPSCDASRGARRRRWAPPLAWGDADEAGHWIEDPSAVPVPGWERRSRGDAAAFAADLAEMFGRPYSITAAALEMRIGRNTLDKRISRARRQGATITPSQSGPVKYAAAR